MPRGLAGARVCEYTLFALDHMSRVSARTVCVVGQHELDYPRNVVNQRLLRSAGYELVLCHDRGPSPFRTWVILAKYFWRGRHARVVFATEGAHRHVPLIKLLAKARGQKVIFDPFISLFNTEVEDRRVHAPGSLYAWRANFHDSMSCHAADYLLFDTEEHKQYFFERYKLDKPYRVLTVGVDEEVFRPRSGAEAPSPQASCDVFFYGTYIPLQGIDVILDAAERLRDEPAIRITLLGDGQEYPRIRALAVEHALSNVDFVGRQSPEALAQRIARADICLGIFDRGRKAGQVVPNKVVQCAAMAKPIVTCRSDAVARYFEDGVSALLTPAGDGAALASAIVRLARDRELRAKLAAGARAVFERSFSSTAQVEVMRAVIEEAAAIGR